MSKPRRRRTIEQMIADLESERADLVARQAVKASSTLTSPTNSPSAHPSPSPARSPTGT